MIWQLIETAPRDGTSVLLSDGMQMAVAYWSAPGITGKSYKWLIQEYPDGDYNSWIEFEDPTHWMPLPPLPSSQI